jgi:hypothetical protein
LTEKKRNYFFKFQLVNEELDLVYKGDTKASDKMLLQNTPIRIKEGIPFQVGCPFIRHIFFIRIFGLFFDYFFNLINYRF